MSDTCIFLALLSTVILIVCNAIFLADPPKWYICFKECRRKEKENTEITKFRKCYRYSFNHDPDFEFKRLTEIIHKKAESSELLSTQLDLINIKHQLRAEINELRQQLKELNEKKKKKS